LTPDRPRRPSRSRASRSGRSATSRWRRASSSTNSNRCRGMLPARSRMVRTGVVMFIPCITRMSRCSSCLTRCTTTRSPEGLSDFRDEVTSMGKGSFSTSPSREAAVKCERTPRPRSHIHVARTNCRHDSVVIELRHTPGRTGIKRPARTRRRRAASSNPSSSSWSRLIRPSCARMRDTLRASACDVLCVCIGQGERVLRRDAVTRVTPSNFL